jgi:predicted phosphodiesterase
MALAIVDPEVFGVTADSVTLSFVVADGSGRVAAPARVLVDGETRVVSEGPAGTRLLRVTGLEAGREHRIDVAAAGAPSPAPSRYFSGVARTLPAPRGRLVARFATLNDLHFGEPRFGGTLLPDGRYGDEAPGHPVVRETEGQLSYWRVMNDDAVAEINGTGVDAVVIKGDIANRGRRGEFEIAARTFAGFKPPWHAFLGNHDYYGLQDGEPGLVDGYAMLGQPRLPRTIELGGWRLVLVDTVDPGHHSGVFPADRRRWLASALEETRERRQPTLVVMHHQPVPPEHAGSYPNTIGIVPVDSMPLFELLARHQQVKAVLIGHTHRNRVRRYAPTAALPFAEVNCVKDYPGGFAVYELYDDGTIRQEVRRTASARALAHSTRCRDFFGGRYRDFALGSIDDRCWVSG